MKHDETPEYDQMAGGMDWSKTDIQNTCWKTSGLRNQGFSFNQSITKFQMGFSSYGYTSTVSNMHHSNFRLWLWNLMKWSKIVRTKISEIAKFEFTKNSKSFQNNININHKNWDQYSINQNSVESKNSKISSTNHEVKLKSFYSIENFLKLLFWTNSWINWNNWIQIWIWIWTHKIYNWEKLIFELKSIRKTVNSADQNIAINDKNQRWFWMWFD